MSDGLLRVSEAAAVDVDHLVEEALLIPRSKTDQEARGSAVYLGPRTRRLVGECLRACKVEGGAVFRSVDRWGRVGARLSPASVWAIIRRRAREVLGLVGVRGHSLRVGSAQELSTRGAGRRGRPDGLLEHAQRIAGHASPKTTKLDDRTADTIRPRGGGIGPPRRPGTESPGAGEIAACELRTVSVTATALGTIRSPRGIRKR